MKRLLLLLNFVFLLFAFGHSQSVTIGSGTTASGSTPSDPIDGYFNSFRYQVVYTKAELESGGIPMAINDEITALGFDIDGDYGGGNLLGYTIKIGHTSATNAASHINVTMTTVKTSFDYNPSVTSAGSFDMITFDNDFIWNGTDNIVVEICSDGQNSFTSPYGSVRGSSVANGSRRYRVDGGTSCGVNTNTTNSHKPNIRFDFTDVVPPSCTDATTANVALSPNCPTGNSVTFDVTNMGSASSLTVTNDAGGTAPMDIVATGTGFTVTDLPSDGSSVTITLTPDDDPACILTLGPITLAVCPPANDDLCNAIALSINAVCTGDSYTNLDATTQTNEPTGTCFTGGAQKTVWFSFVAPASGTVEITTDIAPGDLNDSEIALYGEGGSFDCTDLSTLTAQVACDQDGGNVGDGWMSVINENGLTSGATYYVQVSGYNNSDGDFCIEVREPCSISAITDGGTSTACDSGTNEYTQDVIVTYGGAPGSGTLDVTIDGITVTPAITGSPQTVTVPGLTADGLSKNVSAVFSADGGCSLTENSVFTAPVACGCLINSITDANTGVMNCTGGTYDYEVVVDFSNDPGSGTLELTAGTGSASVAIGSSPQTVLITGLTTDGNAVDVTASFSADAGCTATSNGLFTAPSGCPPANDNLCNAIALGVNATCTGDAYSNLNATIQANEPTGTCFTGGAQKTVWFSFVAPASGNVEITTDIAPGDLNDSEIALYGEGGSFDCTDLSTLTAQVACDQDGGNVGDGWMSVINESGLTGGATYYVQVSGYNNSDGDFCIEINEPCNISAIADGGTSTACDSGTNEYAQDVIVTYGGAPGSGTLDVTIDGITVTPAITGSPQTVTVSGLTADGLSKNVSAVFSADGGCSLTENGVFTAPVACGCLINSITDANTGVMNCIGTTYNYEVVVNFSNDPGSGTLNLTAGTGLASVAIGSSPQTVLITGLTADGNAVDVIATFSDDGGCTATANALFTAPVACPPVNDDCVNATVIPVTLDETCSNQVMGTNVGSTASGLLLDPSCSDFGSGIDNWYSVTVPGSGEVTIEMSSAGGPTDWAIQVYSGDCGSLVRVECDDDDGPGLFPLVSLTGRTSGEELLVRVFEYQNNATGAFNICAYSAPECGANSAYLEMTNGSYVLDEPCEDGNGWTYYSDPDELGNYMFAIEWDPNNTGANAAAKANATVTIDVGNMITAEDGTTSASYGMGRYWNVDLAGEVMNSLVNVRFFYAPAEKTAVENAASNFATTNDVPNNGFSWFKTDGTEFTSSDITAMNFQSSVILLSEDGTGTENGITYVQFDDISSFSGGTGGTGAGAGFLPIELMIFEGVAMEKDNKLSWETATEENASHFVIERSADGRSAWQGLGEIAAVGNSQAIQQYSYLDTKPLPTAYYRLRMVDQDNSFAYSPIIQLRRVRKDATLTLFPVPAQEEVRLNFELEEAGLVTVSLFNLTGQLVNKSSLNLPGGIQQEILDIRTLTSGVYMIVVETDNHRYVERLIKQ